MATICPNILVGNTGEENQNFLWLNNPDRPGHFIDATEDGLPQIADNTQGIALADLDDDGDLDMVVANEDPPNRLYLNDGNANFTDHSDRLELVTPLETRQVYVRDFTGDGSLDILFFNLTSNAGEWEKDPQIRLLVDNGEGRYVDESAERMPENKFSVYAGAPVDLNRDGSLDLIFGPIEIPGFSPMQYRAYINDGKGNFTDQTDAYIPDQSTGRGWGMAVGDLNGDNLNDILVGGWGTQARLLMPAE
ncbi:MAG: VCBS repeat-containing protein [Balneolaceae bacterium]|nr:VCBS repeat-containing protein [Balneolaceae bacterium]